ncbi:MAG: zinc-binding dehydrogenase [Bacteroidota bacterium]
MKAAVLNAINQPLIIQEVVTPEPEGQEVLIQLKASALNHRDVWIQKGLYPGMNLPCILGADGSGIVVKTGDEVDEKWLAKEVVINPGMEWGDNVDFAENKFRILGMPENGTFAEFLTIPVKYVYEKPEYLDFEQSAALPLAGVTAYRALFTKAKLKPNDKVLITGIGGGVAQLLLSFSLAIGCDVFVTSGKEDKLKQALHFGARGGANYKDENWHKALINEAGFFDVIIDGAAGKNFNYLIDLAAPGARIVVYGGTNGNISQVLPAKLFFKQIKIMGTTMGSDTDFNDMLTFVKKYQIVPVTDITFPLEELILAMRRMEQGEQCGKIIIKP